MLELRDWIARVRPEYEGKPWLILGKGPTFGRHQEFDLGSYNLLSLNHVVNELQVAVAHVIDVDVVEACAEHLPANADWLVMPRVPHVHGRVGGTRLEDYFDAVPVLRRLDQEGRLVWYNAETAGAPVGDSPIIEVRYFSSEAALSLLGELGADQVRSLGVDGGSGYSASFSSSSSTRLANGQPSFDVQFAELDRISRRFQLDYRPLIEPLRIYVGASRRDLVALRVLAWSIQQHASIAVRVIPLIDSPIPKARSKANRPRTGFSFSRFLIPELAGYEGRAVYLDSDMLVFGDIKELADIPLGAHAVLCTYQAEPPGPWLKNEWFHAGRQFSVMVLDCGQLSWKIDEIVAGLDEGRYGYRELLFDLVIVADDKIGDALPPEWNHLEHYEPGRTKLLHYTLVDRQPWRAAGNPLEGLWFEHYREAVATGAVPPDEVRELVAEGLVRRELLAHLDVAPARRRYANSAADVALEAAFDRIDELEGRQLRGRVRRVLRPLAPYVRRARALAPQSRIAASVERVAGRLRDVLR